MKTLHIGLAWTTAAHAANKDTPIHDIYDVVCVSNCARTAQKIADQHGEWGNRGTVIATEVPDSFTPGFQGINVVFDEKGAPALSLPQAFKKGEQCPPLGTYFYEEGPDLQLVSCNAA